MNLICLAFCVLGCSACPDNVVSQPSLQASCLRVELLKDASRVWECGRESQLTLEQALHSAATANASGAHPKYQAALVRTATPLLSWELRLAEGTDPDSGRGRVPGKSGAPGMQRAFRVRVASSLGKLLRSEADVWDSGKVLSSAQSCRLGTVCGEGRRVNRRAKASLKENTVYYWNVEIWDSADNRSSLSEPASFATADGFTDEISRLPLVKTDEVLTPRAAKWPMPCRTADAGLGVEGQDLIPAPAAVFDFGRDAFSQFTLVYGDNAPDSVVVRIGEKLSGGRVDRSPGGSLRYAEYRLPVAGIQDASAGTPGTVALRRILESAALSSVRDNGVPKGGGCIALTPALRPDKRNSTPLLNESGVAPILMPKYIGEVFPFRYLEIEMPGPAGTAEVAAETPEPAAGTAEAAVETPEPAAGTAEAATGALRAVVRHRVTAPFDSEASFFHCSDSVLNAVWELCRYTVEATSFCGTYVDGDRERIPYEADAIINQLSHYAIDSEYTMARHSVRHLVYNPTWPTEWILQSLIMVWNDYMYTGDDTLIRECYEDLKAKTLVALREDNGLVSTRLGKCTPEFYRSIHFKGARIRDIVDWPQTGAAGIEKENDGEADGFVFSDFNAVVNAYHYKALRIMSDIAGALDRTGDARAFSALADRTFEAFNTLLYDGSRSVYRDGVGVDHSSLHTNMFALAFGLVPRERVPAVTDFVKSRGMACSVYGAQFLLDALYDYSEADYALALMVSKARRSWYNMIACGSTITMEAWDNVYKPNLDWNHPWGAAPANVIARKLMGVEPLEPGFSKVRIRPQPGSLQNAEILVPSIRGGIRVGISAPGDSGQGSTVLNVQVPPGVAAEVWIPSREGGWRTETVGAGSHRFEY